MLRRMILMMSFAFLTTAFDFFRKLVISFSVLMSAMRFASPAITRPTLLLMARSASLADLTSALTSAGTRSKRMGAPAVCSTL